jgi:2-methylaconitate cis-trans-isomerase PrpF
MQSASKRKIPAVFMRGGSSKGVFFHERDLPVPLSQREALLLRVFGSAEVNLLVVDGMGGATANTRKLAIIRPSQRSDCDVDFIYGAVGADGAKIDWSGSCEQFVAAVGPFAIQEGLIAVATNFQGALAGALSSSSLGVSSGAISSPALSDPAREQLVRIWQVNLSKRIDAYVPIANGEVQEQGCFHEDGVTPLAAEIRLEFLHPSDDAADASEANFMDSKLDQLLPNGKVQEILSVPGHGKFEVSFINAGTPTVFVRADALGLTGKEPPEQVNKNIKLLEKIETIRKHAAAAIGLSLDAGEAKANRTAVLQIVYLAKPQSYSCSNGRTIQAEEIDVLARFMSMGKLHHAGTDSGSIALGIAAALPGTLANQMARTLPGIPTRIGHVSGALTVGAEVSQVGDRWVVEKALISRSARRLMSGWVYVP